MKRLALALLGLAIAFGCAYRAKTHPPIGQPVYAQKYAYVQTEPGTFIILAEDRDTALQVMKKVGCGICQMDFDQTRHIIVVRLLQK